MRNLIRFFFLITLVWSVAAFAVDPCPTNDLNSDPNNPSRWLPVPNQHDTNMCYAYSSSFVANVYLMKTGQYSAPLVSPAYSALLVNREPRGLSNDSLGGGDAEWVLGALSRRGHICGQREVEQRLEELRSAGNFADTGAVLEFLSARSIIKSFPIAARTQPFCRRNPAAIRWVEAHDMERLSQTEILRHLFNGCASRNFELPLPKSAKNLNDSAAQNLITRNLSRGFPVEAGIACFDRFQRTTTDARSVQAGVLPRTETDDCIQGKHSIALTGQKMINGQCHYQIRNSFGALWRGAGATYCSCIDRQNKYVDNCRPENAKKILGCWYTRDRVMSHMYGANGLL